MALVIYEAGLDEHLDQEATVEGHRGSLLKDERGFYLRRKKEEVYRVKHGDGITLHESEDLPPMVFTIDLS